jgi:hypothetical protein
MALAETKELIAGFTMIRAKSREEAIEWVKRWPSIGQAPKSRSPLIEFDDFGPR